MNNIKNITIQSMGKAVNILTDVDGVMTYLSEGLLPRHLIPNYTVVKTNDSFDMQLKICESNTCDVQQENNCLSIKSPKVLINNYNIAHIVTYLFQKPYQELGLYYFHGSAVEKDNRSIVLLGQTLSGKSTIAFSMVEKGYTHLGDESIIVGGISPKVLAGNSYVAFDPAMSETYPSSIVNKNLFQENSKSDKHYIDIGKSDKQPSLAAIAFLKLGGNKNIYKRLDTDWAAIRLFEETSRIIRGVGYTFNVQYPLSSIDSYFNAKKRLDYCMNLAKNIPIYTLTGSLESITKQIDSII